MRVGYSYWGFLGDEKYGDDCRLLSTPDGNAFYSWSIINKLQQDGCEVIGIMPDRDEPGFRFMNTDLFSAWCKSTRLNSYLSMNHIEYGGLFDYKNRKWLTQDALMNFFDIYDVNKFDVILHEWRMPIPGRNTNEDFYNEDWQPDLFIQETLIKYCIDNNVKLVLFDLDYKISDSQAHDFAYGTNNVYIFELGNKWKNLVFETDGKCRKVYIPFDFRYINQFRLKSHFDDKLVYVGNRYERDWCIDKYVKDVPAVKVYGNWLEGNRDSDKQWPNITFGKRLQTKDMHDVYSNSATTILLAKRDYCENNFMTARILEAIFYGCVPLFIEEYGEKCIQFYAGAYKDLLTVRNCDDVIDISNELFEDSILRNNIVSYLRMHLSFMDVTGFVKQLYSIIME